MYCCTDICGTDTTTSDNDHVTAFPGQRRLVRTQGNALREYNPMLDDVPKQSLLLLVQVPDGSKPGDTIHVQIPNENRIMAVQIPEGVSEFHVSYEPNPTPMFSSPFTNHNVNPTMEISPTSNDPYTNSTSMVNRGSSNTMSGGSYSSPPNMVLVQVPDGVQPGSTIKVFTGENKFVMAQVPPGVREFYVTTESQPMNRNPQPTTNLGTNRNAVTNNTNNSNQQGGNDFGMVAPILAGAALMGAAGYMISQHGESETIDGGDDGYDDDDW